MNTLIRDKQIDWSKGIWLYLGRLSTVEIDQVANHSETNVAGIGCCVAVPTTTEVEHITHWLKLISSAFCTVTTLQSN